MVRITNNTIDQDWCQRQAQFLRAKGGSFIEQSLPDGDRLGDEGYGEPIDIDNDLTFDKPKEPSPRQLRQASVARVLAATPSLANNDNETSDLLQLAFTQSTKATDLEILQAALEKTDYSKADDLARELVQTAIPNAQEVCGSVFAKNLHEARTLDLRHSLDEAYTLTFKSLKESRNVLFAFQKKLAARIKQCIQTGIIPQRNVEFILRDLVLAKKAIEFKNNQQSQSSAIEPQYKQVEVEEGSIRNVPVDPDAEAFDKWATR